MASVLTSTSSKSGYLYLVLLALVVTGLVYLFVFEKPPVAKDWQRQAFRLNAAAFSNGIHLAHARFLTNNQDKIRQDWWQDKGVGLDYNPMGFPIGTDISEINLTTPASAENCRQIWQFVLGPLQPEVSLKKTDSGYWVELTEDKICVFYAFDLQKMQLSYHSLSGKVDLTE